MNPLTKRAIENRRREAVLNYIIAGAAGVIIGAMFALAI